MANQKYKIELTALDKTKKAFSGLKNNLGGVTKFAGGAAASVLKVGLAATAAGAAIGVLAKKSFDFADAIGKVSTRTGLSTDTVQAFQIAAVEAGVDIEVANKSLEKFTSSIGDAAKGLKTQRDILDDLGVELKNADGTFKSTDEVLREVSDGVAGLSSEFEKSSVGAALFGRAGRQVMDVLDDGGAAFDSYIEKANAYGLILNESGIRQSEKFNDTLALVSRQIKVATTAVSIAFLPILQDLSTQFSDLIKETTGGAGGVEEFGNAFRDVAIEKFMGFIDGIADIADAIHKFRIDIASFATDMENSFIQAKLGILETERAFLFMQGAITVNEAKQQDLRNAIQLNNAELETFKNNTVSGGEAIRQFGANMEEYFVRVFGEGSEETNNFLENYNALLEEIEKTATTDQQSPLAVFKKDFQDINKLIETNTINAVKKMEDTLVDFVMTGKASFADLARSIIADLARIQIRKGLTKFATMIGIEGFEGGGFTGHGARTGGIDGRGGFPAILHPNETVIDHTKGQQMGQQPVSVNFSIQATDASGFDELLVSRKNQIVAMISQAMNQKGKVGLT